MERKEVEGGGFRGREEGREAVREKATGRKYLKGERVAEAGKLS